MPLSRRDHRPPEQWLHDLRRWGMGWRQSPDRPGRPAGKGHRHDRQIVNRGRRDHDQRAVTG